MEFGEPKVDSERPVILFQADYSHLTMSLWFLPKDIVFKSRAASDVSVCITDSQPEQATLNSIEWNLLHKYEYPGITTSGQKQIWFRVHRIVMSRSPHWVCGSKARMLATIRYLNGHTHQDQQ